MLSSVDAIFDALGGRETAQERLGVAASTLSSWKERGIPASRYMQIRELLSGKGEPSPDLFFRRRKA